MYKLISFVDVAFSYVIAISSAYFLQWNFLAIHTIVLAIIQINYLLHNPLYAYRDILRKPNTNVHSITVYGIPVVDFIITGLGAYALSQFLRSDLLITFIGSYLLGQVLHYIFGVNTRFFNRLDIRFQE